ncbi:MATE family efflux transporter [Methanobrevibacter sp.]|uniref:MATE family efflux transporter n=1 Tax=Methanobrevibacter sp. TaxID=66852 RepID=UPI00388E5446
MILNTPEVAGKIFFSSQIAILTYLCSTYYGAAGLIAFLVYDNSETLVYMALSGIMKTMSPIVTVFHKEMDYKAVEYIISKSIKQLLIICVPISVILFVFPDIVVYMFSVSDPVHAELVCLAIRITVFGLIGRCLTVLLANYTQAIQENKIALAITLMEEFLISIFGALLLTHWIGGVGIWIAILLSEVIPVLFYVIVAEYFKKTHEKGISRILLLQDSHLINMTYTRENYGFSEEFSKQIETIFEKPSIVMQAIGDLSREIFEHDSKISEIDVTLRMISEKTVILLIDNGELYNPFHNEKFMNSQNIKKLADLNCKFDYASTLGFNKSYLRFNDDSNLLE